MEFGKIDRALLDKVNFRLPNDGLYTQQLKPAIEQPKLFLGGAKWGRKEWVGLIYPAKTKESEFLDHYIKNFNGIELNTTHYQIYPAATIQKWTDKAAGTDFKFCPKFPQSISHYSDLSGTKAFAETDRFLGSIFNFGAHLGPSFLQLSERFGPQRREALFNYLQKLPKDFPVTLEVRHPDWFGNPEIRTELFQVLHELSIGAVITDVSGRRDCTHMEVTSPVTFIRFVGNGLHTSDYERIDDWVKRMKSWLQKDIREIHFYMHQPDELYTPQLTDYLIRELNKHCGLSLTPPKLIGQTGDLFG
ncbi:DUF72 domain-containing protein [Fluviicola taffensis]|uniref:DUF72 domain-containing protein n=1 Tax=Fluviicola taffensis TaxID=191579 RepID=UPI003137C288